MSHKKQAYENLATSIIEKFNLRGIDGYYADSAEDALEMVQRFFPPGCSISWGGSETLNEIGLIDVLRDSDSDFVLYDRMAVPVEEREALYSKIVGCDYFLMSSNAITLDGQLINIDGMGNRIACLITGPKNVIIVAGMNKIVTNVEEGINRTHNFAAPPNTVRLGKDTPCADHGRCGNCLSEDCICCNTVITRKSRVPGRIKVILVGEELGF
ncbi:MAG: lactate utilization protein [Lachnospiraceae bacterium]|nr:lactate utilization protein [Lachnospiraceae bacterium]